MNHAVRSSLDPAETGAWRGLLGHPFRPFFLLAGLYAVVTMAGWVGYLFFDWPVISGVSPLRWHAHEMLFGFVPAAIAGFLLTAMCNWTGARPLAGPALVALAALWIAGRVVMWSSAVVPPVLIAVVDVSFLVATALVAARTIIAAGNRRNLVMVVVVGLLALASGLHHAGMWGWLPGWDAVGEDLALGLILVLMTVIGGRIIPAFTANWMARRGMDRSRVVNSPTVGWLTVAATALVFPAGWISPLPWLGAAVALVAGLLHGVRLAGWAGWACWRDPLVWILHLGYAWIVVGLLLKGLTLVLVGIPDAAWLHALGAGAMATLILGVMTRVAMGHTGRPLEALPAALAAYILITLAAIVRLAAAFGWVDFRIGLVGSAALWIAAFTIFLAGYCIILVSPRADGRPG